MTHGTNGYLNLTISVAASWLSRLLDTHVRSARLGLVQLDVICTLLIAELDHIILDARRGRF